MIGKDYKWYVIYIIRHHEKRVSDWIGSLGIKALYPTKKVSRRWSDRIKVIEEPLFPSYLFVRVSCIEYFEILNYPAVLKYVSFNGEAATIPECQIKLVRLIIDGDFEPDLLRYNLSPGERISISQGPLKGLKGYFQDYKNGKRLVVRIDAIRYSLLLNIPEDYLIPDRVDCCVLK